MPLLIIGSLLGLTASADTALERIPVALVNNDELVTILNDDGDEEIILASRPLITELITGEATNVDWVITSSESAATLLAAGDVYAIFEIPKNFSETVSNLGDEDASQATFSIRTDPTRSYLAGIIGDQIGDTLAKSLSVEFSQQTTKGLFTVIIELGDAFGEAADAATEVSDATTTLSEGITTLSGEMPTLTKGANDLASGYTTFDEGLQEYTDGITALSDGLDALSAGTSGLADLNSGISTFTNTTTTLSNGLSAVLPNVDDGPVKVQLTALISGLASLAGSGPTLAAGANTALTGITSGVTSLDKGADALDEAGVELAEGSAEIATATKDFAAGIDELAEGIGELDSGAGELAEGVLEFAEGLSDGAQEIQDSGTRVPSDERLDVLSSPVVFDAEDRTGSVSVPATLGSIIVPLGLWLVVLATLLLSPHLSSRSLSATTPVSALMRHSLSPLLALGGIQVLIALALLHTLGGASWSTVGVSALVIASGLFAYLALHYLVWVWKASWLPALSLALAALQIASVETLVPTEIFPAPYRLLEGLTPLSWFSDALLAAVSGGEGSRILAGVLSLLAVGALATLVSVPVLKTRQRSAQMLALGLTSATR
jgi:putative membrane protein